MVTTEDKDAVDISGVRSDPGAGISTFLTSFNLLETKMSAADRKRLSQDVLMGFHQFPQMAESIVKSTLLSKLALRGSDAVQNAMESRWRRIRISPISVMKGQPPVAISIEVVFILEQTEDDDCTEEVFHLAQEMIEEKNHQGFVAQLVVNNRTKRFMR